MKKNFNDRHKCVGGGISRSNMPRIVQGGVITEGLRKEFSFRDRRDGSTAVRVKERRER